MSKNEIDLVVVWASGIANKLEREGIYVGVNQVIDAFINANKELNNPEEAMKFVEKELTK